ATKQPCAPGGRLAAAACVAQERVSLSTETARPLRMTRERVAVVGPESSATVLTDGLPRAVEGSRRRLARGCTWLTVARTPCSAISKRAPLRVRPRRPELVQN